MTYPAIELRDCSLKSKNDVLRLNSVTLGFVGGAITAVIGPNGAGKSTLLALASGLLQPTSGSVLINEQLMSSMSVRELARERAVLTQDQNVAFGFSVSEVVGWGRTPWRGRGGQAIGNDANFVAAALETVGMFSERERPINELSGGERKRVHLARIIAQQSSIVLLDEPDSDLDLLGLESLDKTIREMNSRGVTVVLTSHDLVRISRLATQVVVVARGSVIAQGGTREILNSDVLSDAYGTEVQVQWSENGVIVQTGSS